MVARKKKGGSGKRGGGATRKPAATRKRSPAARKPAARRRRSPSLAERLTGLAEHMAAGALRQIVERGGAEIAAWLPAAPEMRREAGQYLKELRELAGLTRDELAEAAELRDHSMVAAVEAGTATLSFELILRMAAILARHDPVPFISKLTRTYNPVVWDLLEDWGVGRLPLQYERERHFVNILRGHDEARALEDEDFEQVLHFTRAAFETALHFALQSVPAHDECPPPAPPPRR